MDPLNVVTGHMPQRITQPLNLHSMTRKELLEYFQHSYTVNEWLFTSLKEEKCFYCCPDRLRLPLIFYYTHTAVVYINKLNLAMVIKERVNKDFESMFETGVDEHSWDDTENFRQGNAFVWPKLDEVVDYRRKVRKIVEDLINEAPINLPITEEDPLWALVMGIEHEHIHIETSSVLIRQLPVEMVRKPSGWSYGPLETEDPAIENRMVRQSGSYVKLGKDADCPLYGWDNEYGQMELDVPDFEVSEYMVTNREMLEFVKDGGYDNDKYWDEEGLKWRKFRNIRHPPFWVCDQRCVSNCGGSLKHYTHCHSSPVISVDAPPFGLRLMFDVVPLPLDWPAEVVYHEAKAFCRWKGGDFRLPTEAECHIIRGLPAFDAENMESTDPICHDNSQKICNFAFHYGSSTPVNHYPRNEKSSCYDSMGNAWEWIEDDFNGLPQFQSSPFYDDFSTPCFTGKHTMIMGGSWASLGSCASRFARFAFRRHFIQHSGFRLVRPVSDLKSLVNIVATPIFSAALSCEETRQECELPGVETNMTESSSLNYRKDTVEDVYHLTKEHFDTSSDAFAIHNVLFQYIKNLSKTMELNTIVIGCGTGKVVFDIVPYCNKVLGTDTSIRCIYVANKFLDEKKFSFTNQWSIDHGESCNGPNEFSIDMTNSKETKKASFLELTWIPFELNENNVVVCLSLDRQQCPLAWIYRIKELVMLSGDRRGIIASKDWSADRLEKYFLPELTCHTDSLLELKNGAHHFTTWKCAEED